MAHTLTEQSFKLFIDLATDAPNWNGSPILDITKEQRGNLTDLKKHGLVTTSKDPDGYDWVDFTDAGIALANENGLDIGYF